jgi:folylpolyglutamate synthase/dihydropteroate synthase
MADKDVDGVLRALAGSRLLREARVICTSPPGGRALPAERLAARWGALVGRPAEAISEPAAALDSALSGGRGSATGLARGRGGGPVVVAGSLYLVGAARAILVSDPALVPDPPLPQPEAEP